MQRLWRSFGFAFAGVAYAWKSQPNFRLEVGIALLAIALGALLGVDLRWVLLLCGLVLAFELINTALEATINLLSPQFHPLAKIAKDCAAAAVLVVSLTAAVLGLWLFGEALTKLLG